MADARVGRRQRREHPVVLMYTGMVCDGGGNSVRLTFVMNVQEKIPVRMCVCGGVCDGNSGGGGSGCRGRGGMRG